MLAARRSSIESIELVCLGMLLWGFIALMAVWNEAASAEPQNFTTDVAEFATAAEAARVSSARFWSGRPLPGDWFAPCPISWSQLTGPASGWTSFTIQNGEVYGWKMSLRGDRHEVLADLIPHEVDHAVRATLCRRSLPRWLDEGCASLFESKSSHERLRGMLRADSPQLLTARSIEESNYPAESSEMTQLYAEGFSLVEYLLTRGSPQDLLTVQQSSEPLSSSLPRVYRVQLPQLLGDWQTWQNERLRRGTQCDCVDCPLHHPRRAAHNSSAKPCLTIWTATWCEPCQRLHSDLRSHPDFRRTLESRFQIIERDWDLNQTLAIQQRIRSVPAFQTPSRIILGYHGPDWLLNQLDVQAREPVLTLPLPRSPPVESPPAEIAQPAAGPVSPGSEARPTIPVPQLPQLPISLPAPVRAVEPPAVSPSVVSQLLKLVPSVISVLTSLGVISGTALTGGVGGVALMLVWNLLQRRATRSTESKAEGGVAVPTHAPFPRELDEAGELLGLRQSEGRVATLDALRGMFLDDELNKLHDSADPTETTVIKKLREAIDRRVDEVAPLTSKSQGSVLRVE